MPRCSLYTKHGSLAARGLYHLPFLSLLCPKDSHPMLPAATFAKGSDLLSLGWKSTAHAPGSVFVSPSDLEPFPRNQSKGCCGPDGADKNVLDPSTMEPVAYEFADCYSSHYVQFDPDDCELVEESPEQPECLVGCVSLSHQTWLVGAACGLDTREAAKRLHQACRKYLTWEAGLSSHHRQISRLPVEILEAAHFLRRFKRREKPQWLFLKY